MSLSGFERDDRESDLGPYVPVFLCLMPAITAGSMAGMTAGISALVLTIIIAGCLGPHPTKERTT